MQKALWYAKDGNDIICRLCAHACVIPQDGHGICGVRRNEEHEIVLPFFGSITALSMDPVEKKPFYHYHPGEYILSAGFSGCNLKCPFCQNHEISQHAIRSRTILDPVELVSLAEAKGSFGLAYTYSEPLVHFEYVLDCCREARTRGIRNALVTNGCIEPGAWNELLPWIDAVNIDLKAFRDETYRDILKGDLDTVKTNIKSAVDSTHAELTMLIVPGMNDDVQEVRNAAAWIASISKSVPFHLSAYRPAWKSDAPPTPPGIVSGLAAEARRYLENVYEGNIAGEANRTKCGVCGKPLVCREGYRITVNNLVKSGSGSVCAFCGAETGIEI